MLEIAARLLDPLLAARTVYTPATSVMHSLPLVLGHFGLEDTQTSGGPLWFLTNVDGSAGAWDRRVLAHYGQDFRAGPDRAGSSHPLTEEEGALAGTGAFQLRWYPSSLFMGRTAWWRNRKWASPSLAFGYRAPTVPADPRQVQTADRLVLRAFVESEAERLYRALQGHDGSTVLLDLDGRPGRYGLHLLVPMYVLLSRYASAGDWLSFLLTLFAPEPGSLPPGTPVFIDDARFEHGQHDPGCECGACDGSGKAFGCRYYDLTPAPAFLGWGAVRAWLETRDCVEVVWAASEGTALHKARLVCERRGYDPVDPFSRAPIPREHHALRP
jgi:hypothetical protein